MAKWKPNVLLRDARIHMGLSHQAVAKAIDVPDPRTVGRWERGISFPRPHYRLRLSELFGKSMEELGLIPPDEQATTPDQEPNQPEADLPPAPTEAPAYKYTIKPSFTSFIGREDALSRVCALLQRPAIRLITILGPGGVGKTRLASEVARASREQFAENICLVTLTTINSSELVLPTIARELQIRESNPLTLEEDLQRFFSTKQAFLLILDNFEHVLHAASVIEQLLTCCPCLKVLVTSRVVLHLSGEHEFTLEPLPLPEQDTPLADFLHYDALQLFIQRAQARLHTFQATPENLSLIGQICTTLDGLPLAIELAAARVKMFPLPALLQEVSESRLYLRIPQHETYAASSHAQTLADTIRWSYDLLDEQEQWLFRQIAVFPGGCTLPAAKMIWASSPYQENDALSLLMSLLDKNMIRPIAQEKAQPFFLMLETIRDYGMELLKDSGELAGARETLARYCLDLLTTAEKFLRGAQQREWLNTLDQERQNLSAALAWLIESRDAERALTFCDVFGHFCGLRGYWSEEAHWLASVLDLSSEGPASKARGRVLRRAAHLAYRLRDFSTARRYFEESIALAREHDDQFNLAGALGGLARVFYRTRNFASAAPLFEEGVVAARNSGDAWSLANALESLSKFTFRQGNTQEAARLIEESVALARTIGDAESLSRLLNTALTIEIALRNFDKAAEVAQESFAVASALGNKPLIALALNGQAEAAAARQQFQNAAQIYKRRLQLAHELHDQTAIARTKLKLSEIALQQKDFESAHNLAQESLIFFQEHQDVPNSDAASQLLAVLDRLRVEG